MWSKARGLLGLKKDQEPTAVIDGGEEVISKPQNMGNLFNNFFVDKVKSSVLRLLVLSQGTS